MAEITLTVFGTPAPQGSKRAFAIRKNGVLTGRAAVIESSHDRVKAWRQAVIDAAESQHACQWLHGPVQLSITFWIRRPKSHYGTGKNAAVLRGTAPNHPAKAPDLSKLVRATEDALTACGVWQDDAQVVSCDAAKAWCGNGQAPGAVITIREVWEQEP